jgi:hypothetical protein
VWGGEIVPTTRDDEATMLHRRYVIHRLEVGGRSIPLRHGDVVVAARAESGQLDWEVVAHALSHTTVPRQTHVLVMECLRVGTDDAELTVEHLSGTAFLVRNVDRALVFRGDGPLDGVDLSSLLG